MASLYPVMPKDFERANYKVVTKSSAIYLGCSLWFLFQARHFPSRAQRKLYAYLEKHYLVEPEDIETIHFNPVYFSPRL